jgi:ATP-dependent Lon protease
MGVLNYSLIPNPTDEISVRTSFPWIGDRPMNIPTGWFGLVYSTCAEIESIVFPEKVEDSIDYFFATVRDENLFVYVNHHKNVEAVKKNAIASLLNELPSKSRRICHICGAAAFIDRYSSSNHQLPNCGSHIEDETADDKVDSEKDNVLSINDLLKGKNSQGENGDTQDQTDDNNLVESNGSESNVHFIKTATIKLYDENIVKKLIKDANTKYRDTETGTKVKEHLKKLVKAGEYRALKPITPSSTTCFDELASDFPNFIEVIEMMRGIKALSSMSEIPRIPATLLLGPPGVGKTMFAEAFAKMMDVAFKVVRMENQQAGGGLVGTADFWSNSKTGAVFNILTENTSGNPVIVIDEVDKSGGDQRYNPINGLYSLLEPLSAESFADEAFPDLPINASKITWILTANYKQWIPEPILSRVRVFDIPPPTHAQSVQVARRIYTTLRDSSTILIEKFDDTLDDSVANLLATMSPRKMRIALEIAFGKAAIAARCYLSAEDIDVQEVEEKMQMGFL